MKNIYILFIGLVVLFASCELTDVVDEAPPNNLVLENVVTDVPSAENLLNGTYSILYNRYYYRHTETLPALLSGSMQVRTVGDRDIEENNMISGNINVREFWRIFYEMINGANSVIEEVSPLLADGTPDQERIMEIIGEAYFLRAWAHFDALRYYGQFYDVSSPLGVVIRTEPANFTTRDKARSSVAEVYEQIIEDLDIAISQAPDFSEAYFASKTAAKALKAKVLLFRGDYEDAAAIADEVIQEGSRSLAPTFSEVFDAGFSSTEMIFMKYSDEMVATDGVTRRKDFIYGLRWLIAGDPLKGLMVGDPRETATYSTTNDAIVKVRNVENFSPTYFIRLGEIYLIKAEALARSGATLNDSKAPLEEIRSRAFGSPEVSAATTIEELLDEIYEEIVLELSFENGSEWFAGIRFDKIIGFKPTVTSTNQYILPIPAREIEANSEIGIADQNPGYDE